MIRIKPKEKPKWYEPRKKLCKWLVDLARWIEPQSPEIPAFYAQQMHDMMITGCHIVRIDPKTAIYGVDEKSSKGA